MLNKSKLNLSVILLVLGLGLIPTGLFIDAYLTDEVSSNVSVVLEAIEEEAVSDIEESYLGLGIPEVIPALFDSLIPEIQTEIVYPIGIPKTLLYIKNKTLEVLPMYINASEAANAIYYVIKNVIENNSTSTAYAESVFFNDVDFESNFSADIKGVSEFMNSGAINLTFSANTTHRLLNGYSYNNTNYPGIFSSVELGIGLLNWLDFYSDAFEDNGDNRTLIQMVYDCSWESNQLQNFSAYIKSYLWEIIVKNNYTSKGYTTLEEYALDVFYSQWSNGTMKPSGISLDLIGDDFTQRIYGLEVGRDEPSNITTDATIDLWDPMNPSSFVNITGIKKWFNASGGDNSTEYDLKFAFALTNKSYDVLMDWLITTVKDTLVPVIFSLPFPVGFGMTPTEFTIDLLLDQWANATTFEEGINLRHGLKGFEVGIPEKTNITLSSAINLFNTSTISSFIHRDGILDWIDAYQGDTDTQNDILSTFNLDLTQFDMLTDWLFITMRYNVIPNITAILTGSSMRNYAQNEFYTQWSDARIFEDGLVLGPVLGLDLVSEWEIGIPIKSNIDVSKSEYLWNEDEDYSITHFKGISLWFKAMKDTSTYNYLQNNLEISDTEMDTILEWLIRIREDYVVPSSQNEADLPVDHYTLGDNIFLGFVIAGGVLTGLGVVGVILQVIFKRK
ncbi:MAG: hypothetical protein HWN81_00990 [Candidatus Lokiarchaeota archaeon]|nr:hypothetical protein [Candidatus Lokiarchaeota archaeon]